MVDPLSGTTGYTSWVGHAAWQRYLLNGNESFVAELLPRLAGAYRDQFKKQWWRDDGFNSQV